MPISRPLGGGAWPGVQGLCRLLCAGGWVCLPVEPLDWLS